MKVELKKIVEALNTLTDGFSLYFNTETYKLVTLNDEYNEKLSDDDLSEYADWEIKEINKNKEVIYSDKYISLPTQYDIFEHQIMKNFCHTLPDFLIDVFFDAINKKRAFKNFKYLIVKHHLSDKWYEYKNKELRNIAIEWCKANSINFI